MWKTSAFARRGLAVAIACSVLGFGGARVLAQEADAQGDADVAAPPSSELLEITGTIEAAERDILGQATQLRIVSQKQGAFLISEDGKGDELKGHVGAKVTVTAQRVRDEDGNELVSVQGYTLDES